jgi:hypothetical protein
MNRHLHHAVAKSSRQHHLQHDLAALSPALLGIYITPAGLGSAITSMTQQHHSQHNSTSTSRSDQVCLGSAIASMTQ